MKCKTCGKVTTKPKKVIQRKVTKKEKPALTEPAADIAKEILVAKETAHWTILADMVNSLKEIARLSERELAKHLTISKSEIHRLLQIANLHIKYKVAAVEYNTEKYVLLEWDSIRDKEVKQELGSLILNGTIRKREQLRELTLKV